MPLLFLMVFIGVPIAEIALFIEIGGQIGLGWTLFSIFATAVIGTLLVRQQGLQTMARARTAMGRNELPVGEVLAGVCILVAAALLLTPGFLTDALGFVLLIPPLRALLARGIVGRMKKSGRFQMHTSGMAGGAPFGQNPYASGPAGKGPIIDGEFQDLSPDAVNPGPADPNSPWAKEGPAEEIEAPKQGKSL